MITTSSSVIKGACARQNLEQHRRNYQAQDEFVVVEDFLPAEVLKEWDLQFEQLRPHIHRNRTQVPRRGAARPTRSFDSTPRR